MDGYESAQNSVPFVENGFNLNLRLFYAAGDPAPTRWMYVPSVRIRDVLLLEWVRNKGLLQDGGYMIELPKWNARVDVHGRSYERRQRRALTRPF